MVPCSEFFAIDNGFAHFVSSLLKVMFDQAAGFERVSLDDGIIDSCMLVLDVSVAARFSQRYATIPFRLLIEQIAQAN